MSDKTQTKPNTATDLAKPATDLAALFGDEVLKASSQQMDKAVQSASNGASMFPKIKIQNGVKKPKFEVGELGEMESFIGSILVIETVKELYVGQNNPVPECVSTGGINGTVHGACNKCRFGRFEQGQRSACKEYRKTIVSIVGQPGVFEMKVPATSLDSIKKFVMEVGAKKTDPRPELGAINLQLIKFSLIAGEKKGVNPWGILVLEWQKFFYDDAKANKLNAEEQAHAINSIQSFGKYKSFYIKTPATLAIAGTPSEPRKVEGEIVQSSKVDDKIHAGKGDEVPF